MPTFHSFPSGHTNTAFALAIAVSFLIPRWRGGLLAVASVVGFSRVAVNAHFLTDVIGGAALAVLTTWWLRQGFAAYGLVFTKDGAGEYALRWPGRLIRSWPTASAVSADCCRLVSRHPGRVGRA